MKRINLFALAAAMLAASVVNAQDPVRRVSSNSTFVSNGDVSLPPKNEKPAMTSVVYIQVFGPAPIVGAEVIDLLAGTPARTDSNGFVYRSFVTEHDTFAVEVRVIGRKPIRRFVPADSTMLTFDLEKIDRAYELPTVNTNAVYRLDRDEGRREGFAQRCAVNHVTCTDNAVFRDYSARTFSQTLTRVSDDVRRTCGGSGATARCAIKVGDCTPEYFLNGFLFKPVGQNTLAALDDALAASDIQGVEIYGGTSPLPMKFVTPYNSRCKAAIVIWTK